MFTKGSGTNVVTLPAFTKAGVRQFIVIHNNNSNGVTNWATPTGWTLLGTQQIEGPTGIDGTGVVGGGAYGIWYRDWQAGDPTTVTFTSQGGGTLTGGNTIWSAFTVLARGTMSVVSDTFDSTARGATSTNVVFASFPPSAVGDLRIAIEISGVANGDIPTLNVPAVTASTNNPTSLKSKIVEGGVGSTAFAIVIYYSLWEDPSGLDANTSTWSHGASSRHTTRAIVLSDGDNIAPGGADVVEVYEVTEDIVATAVERTELDPESANANWWGGGTNTLGDAD